MTQRSLPAATPPTQPAIDAVASFVETADDLAHEPFMGKDENRGFSFVEGKNSATYTLGDRTHFRSALISFRRLWMEAEPSCYRNVCNLLFKHHAPSRPFIEVFRSDTDQARKSEVWFIPDLRVEDLIDLWINTVFAHGGLKADDKVSRKHFDEMVEKHGLGKMEYGFRMGVLHCSSSLKNLCDHAARPALHAWAAEGLKPSFTLSSPFGRKMKERLPDGSIIIRQASSKFYTEETLGARFSRILRRPEFSSLQFLFENLDASATGKALLCLRSKTIKEILEQLDYGYVDHSVQIDIVDGKELLNIPDMKAFTQVPGKKNGKVVWEGIHFDHKYTFYASAMALSFIDQQLAEFVEEFKNEE